MHGQRWKLIGNSTDEIILLFLKNGNLIFNTKNDAYFLKDHRLVILKFKKISKNSFISRIANAPDAVRSELGECSKKVKLIEY